MNILFASALLVAAIAADKPEANRSNIRTMAVARTPESTTALLAVPIPRPGQVLSNNPVWIQFRVDGYALGAASSQFDRSNEVAISDMGQTVHIVIDNMPYFAVNEPALDPFDEAGWYYSMSYKFELPQRLKEGMHTIRAFLCRSFGESLKGDNAFVAMNFYMGEETDNPNIDLSGPYITYNEPSNRVPLKEGKPVLLDFYVCNAELSSDGYKVRLTIDGQVNRVITSWQPFYIYGLKKGKHTVRLELLDLENKLVPGLFNDVQQSFTVH
jgi:hypothetical protein